MSEEGFVNYLVVLVDSSARPIGDPLYSGDKVGAEAFATKVEEPHRVIKASDWTPAS